ncbi:hypothetical protein F5148DRAFT_344424 [Russula earlei]|uniref:Uncharacterized protein n=1 Tax=Russula earlei TaxID=71964 RepID=A0ACC0UKP7_9AGAM|nr:hypothetical protein F5148DRAFT_344424 [Russula earlei]
MSTSSEESNAFTDLTDLSLKRPLDVDNPCLAFANPEGDAGVRNAVQDQHPLLAEVVRRGVVPTNYLRVFRLNTAIKRQYALDLSLPALHRAAYTTLPAEDYNLSLHTTSGSISAEIWILHDESGNSKRAFLELCSSGGSIDVQVHDPSYPDGDRRARPSVNIEIFSWRRDVSVSLPRCFRGTIAILTPHERIAFSPDLASCMVPLLDIREGRVYCVRGRPPSCKDDGSWHDGVEGDECHRKCGHCSKEPLEPRDALIVDGVTSSLRINWVGEEELPEMKPPKKPGVWEVLWGGLGRLL